MSGQPWDTALLSRIAQVHLRARRAVTGWTQGKHLSHRATTNIEFVDYKEYAPGDPISAVDWRVAGRTDRLVVRRHLAETDVPVTLVVDASADVGTGTPDLDTSKLGAMIVMAATLAMVIDRGGDPVGLEILGGIGHSHPSFPPRRGGLPGIIKALSTVRAEGKANLGDAFRRLAGRVPRRSVVIVLSDLMEEPGAWGPALAALGGRGVDLRVLHIHDPQEWALDFEQAMVLFSPEGGEALSIDPAVVSEQLPEVLEGYLAEVSSALAGARALYRPMASTAALDTMLNSVLGGRL